MALTTIEANGVESVSTGGMQTVLSNTGIDRRSFSRIPTVWEMPDLVQVQIESFDWFVQVGLRELLDEISPITDHHKKMELSFFEPRFDEPWSRMPEDCRSGPRTTRASLCSSAGSAISPTRRHCASRRSCSDERDRRDQGNRRREDGLQSSSATSR